MKKFILLSCFLFFAFNFSFSQGVWTWMSGSNYSGSYPVFGTQGIPSTYNNPSAVYDCYCWTDLQGNFWLYGGGSYSYYADLWEYNPVTSEWTWVNGTGSTFVSPVYGTMGVPSIYNTPGSRGLSGCTWVDSNGDLWLYGGYDDNYGEVYADLWRYNIASNTWTWMSGSQYEGESPVYGIEGVPSPVNYPGSRYEISNSWVDNNGKFWLYGGAGTYDFVDQSDMWMYDPVTNNWTWESGSEFSGTPASYGTMGVFDAANTPGSRYPYAMWTDNNGNLWLFGGGTYDVSQADLWEYNISINQWAWINGAQSVDATGVEGTQCQADSSYYPDGRFENRAVWKDINGNFWMYGGSRYAYLDPSFGDVWEYLVDCNKWIRRSDSDYEDAYANYGTLGLPSVTNQPGARAGGAHWQDNQGAYWIYGGYSYGNLSDVWRYVPDQSCLVISSGIISAIPGTVCAGNSTSLTVAGTISNIQWQISTDGYTFTDISGANSMNYNSGGLTQSTYFRVSSNGSCGQNLSSAILVNVISPNITLNIFASPDSVCYNRSTQLTENGGIGTIQWQSSLDGKSFNNISGATSSFYNAFNLTSPAYYRIKVNNACGIDSSSAKLIRILPLQNAGSVSAVPDSVCSGKTTLLTASGTVGNIQWQSGTNGVSFSNISSANSSTLSISNFTQTSYYRIQVSNSCGTSISNVKMISLIPTPVAGIITVNPDTICAGNLSELNIAGSVGNIQWQYSTDGISFTDIAGAIGNSITPFNLDHTTFFRIKAFNTCGVVYSAIKMIYVIPLPTGGTIAAHPDSVCSGNSSQLILTGSAGKIQWQSSLNGISFSDIPSVNADTFKTPSLTQTTYFRVKASNTCGKDSSLAIKINVYQALVAGTVMARPDTVCSGSSAQLTLTGGSGNIQWQSSLNGISFSNIPSANTDTLNVSNLNQATYYRIKPYNSCGTDSSSSVMIKVNPLPAAGTVIARPDSVCPGSSSQLISAGSAGILQWQSSINGYSFTNIALANSTVYNTPNLIQPAYYRIETSNRCGADSSSVIKVNIIPFPVAGTVTSSRDSICLGTGVVSHLNANGAPGKVQWQSSVDGIQFSNIQNDTSTAYTTPKNLAQTTYYRTIVSNICGSDSSNEVIVHIVPAPSTRYQNTVSGKQISFQADSVSLNVVSYSWDFGDGQTSNTKNSVHTFDSVKTYYVCLTVYNNSNCSYTYCKYISTLNTGIEDVSGNNFIRLYPNPTNDELTIEVSGNGTPKQIIIIDDLGRTLIQLSTYNAKTRMNVRALAAGIYFVKTQMNDGSTQVNKFVKE